MATVVIFHSSRGLRPAERAAADRMRAAGHEVVTPDLFEGRATESVEEGIALEEGIGWDVICERAERAVAGVPPTAVLAGASMGVNVAAELWPLRPQAAGLLLLHGLGGVPDNARRGLPVQLHLARPDDYVPEDALAAWEAAAARAGLAADAFRYPGAGHYFTDAALPDYDAAAADLVWKRALAFLERL
jgi:dienelactone hydrolase